MDRSAARKIEARVRFPSSLNMAPYTTLVMHKQELLKDGGAASASPASLIPSVLLLLLLRLRVRVPGSSVSTAPGGRPVCVAPTDAVLPRI